MLNYEDTLRSPKASTKPAVEKAKDFWTNSDHVDLAKVRD